MNSITDFEKIQSALNAADQNECRNILRGHFITEDPRVTALVANLLRDPSPAVCEAAVEALARCQNTVAAEAAVIHLRSSEPSERGYALDALILLGNHALPTLTRLLDDPDLNVRKLATDGLANIHAPESLPAILNALASSQILVAAAAAEALGMFGNLEAVPILGSTVEQGPDWLRISALDSLGKISGEEALAWICRTPLDSPAYVKAASVNAMSNAAERGSTKAYTFLASLLYPEDPTLNEEIVKTLGRWISNERLAFAQTNGLDYLVMPFQSAIEIGLISQDPQVRAAAVTCLWAVKDFNKTMILEMLSDRATVVRLAALNILTFHSALSLDELASIAMDEQEDTDVRIVVLHSFENILQYNVPISDWILDGVIRLMKSVYEPSIRAAALHVYLLTGAARGDNIAISLLADEEFVTNDAVTAELLSCEADVLLRIAQKCLNEPDPDIRWHVFKTLVSTERALQWAPSLNARALFIAGVADPDWRICVYLVSIMEKWPGQSWGREILRSVCGSLDERVRARAIDAVGSQDASMEDHCILKAHLSDSSEKVRKGAFCALFRWGQSDNDTLRLALLDSYPPIQKAGIVALLLSELNTTSYPLWQLAEQISAQSTHPDISKLGTELRLRLSQC
jgi:HEAT repeat protein